MNDKVALWKVMLIGSIPCLLALLPAMLSNYELFYDEFYFLACASRLDLGYVDHPPLSIWLLAAVRWVLGDSLLAVRLLPGLSPLLLSFLTARLARQLGASPWGQLAASWATCLVFPFNVFFSYFSMNFLDPILWVLMVSILVDLQSRQEPKLWLAFAVAAALAGLNKHPALVFLGVVFLAFGLSEHTLWLKQPKFYLGALIGVVLLLPNVIWQIQYDWISFDFYELSPAKYAQASPSMVLFQQVAALNMGAVLFLFGLIPFFKQHHRVRFILYTYLILVTLLALMQHGRPDRIAGMFPVIFSAAAVGWEVWRDKGWWRATSTTALAMPLLVFALMVPAILPILPPQQLVAYGQRLGMVPKLNASEKKSSAPQWIADRLGWHSLADVTAKVFYSLPEGTRESTVIVADDYGMAGALEYYQHHFSLPKVYSYHNSYHLWGPPPVEVITFITVGIPISRLKTMFNQVHQQQSRHCGLCTPRHSSPDIAVVSDPVMPMNVMWPQLLKLR